MFFVAFFLEAGILAIAAGAVFFGWLIVLMIMIYALYRCPKCGHSFSTSPRKRRIVIDFGEPEARNGIVVRFGLSGCRNCGASFEQP